MNDPFSDRALSSFSRCPSGNIQAECHVGPRFWRCHEAEPQVRLFPSAWAAPLRSNHDNDNASLRCLRVLTKGTSAEVHIAIRQASFGGSGGRSTVIPLEPFSTNKEMGRILIRRGGETIAAGKYTGYGCLLPH